METRIIHELDVRQDFFSDILSGRKKHEIRTVEDTPFEENQILLLKEVDFFKKEYTTRELTVKVTYITPIEISGVKNFAVMSIEVLEGRNI